MDIVVGRVQFILANEGLPFVVNSLTRLDVRGPTVFSPQGPPFSLRERLGPCPSCFSLFSSSHSYFVSQSRLVRHTPFPLRLVLLSFTLGHHPHSLDPPSDSRKHNLTFPPRPTITPPPSPSCTSLSSPSSSPYRLFNPSPQRTDQCTTIPSSRKRAAPFPLLPPRTSSGRENYPPLDQDPSKSGSVRRKS